MPGLREVAAAINNTRRDRVRHDAGRRVAFANNDAPADARVWSINVARPPDTVSETLDRGFEAFAPRLLAPQEVFAASPGPAYQNAHRPRSAGWGASPAAPGMA